MIFAERGVAEGSCKLQCFFVNTTSYLIANWAMLKRLYVKAGAENAGRYIDVLLHDSLYLPLEVVKDFVPFVVGISVVCFLGLVS